jgi:hypothetical protein
MFGQGVTRRVTIDGCVPWSDLESVLRVTNGSLGVPRDG